MPMNQLHYVYNPFGFIIVVHVVTSKGQEATKSIQVPQSCMMMAKFSESQ